MAAPLLRFLYVAIGHCGYIHSEMAIIPSLLVALLGALGSWVLSCFLYGFGELTDRMTSIGNKLE